MTHRLPLILSVTALVVAVAGVTPLGEAARDATQVVRFARNADKVDGIHASKSPKPGRLLALDSARKFPASVMSALSGREVKALFRFQDSDTPKVVEVPCPPGKHAIAGGYEVTGDASDIAVTESRPTGTSHTSSWTIRAVEQNPVASWGLTGYVLCVAGT